MKNAFRITLQKKSARNQHFEKRLQLASGKSVDGISLVAYATIGTTGTYCCI
jgi:hypothetical protein